MHLCLLLFIFESYATPLGFINKMDVRPADFRFTGNERVVKDLGFMQSAYCLDITELRLVAMAIIVLRRNGDRAEFDPTVPVTLHANMYADLFNTSRQNAYQIMDSAAKSLQERRINWVDVYEDTAKGTGKKKVKADRLNDLRWTSQCSYIQALGQVQLYFTPQIIPFLIHLDGHYAGYEIRNLIKLSTSYEFRMYELGVAWKGVGVAVFTKEDLRQRLGVLDENQFKTASNFGRMMNNALKTINAETDLNMAFNTNYAANVGMKGRHVKSYTMTVKVKKEQFVAVNHKTPPASPAPLKTTKKQDVPEQPIHVASDDDNAFLNGLGSNAGQLKFGEVVAEESAKQQDDYLLFDYEVQEQPTSVKDKNQRPFGLTRIGNFIQLWPNEDGSWDYELIIKHLKSNNFQIVGMDEMPDELLRMTEEYKVYSVRNEELGLSIAKNVIQLRMAKTVQRGKSIVANALHEDARPIRKHNILHLTEQQVQKVINDLDFRSRYAPHGEGNPSTVNQYLKNLLIGDLKKIPDLGDYLGF